MAPRTRKQAIFQIEAARASPAKGGAMAFPPPPIRLLSLAHGGLSQQRLHPSKSAASWVFAVGLVRHGYMLVLLGDEGTLAKMAEEARWQ